MSVAQLTESQSVHIILIKLKKIKQGCGKFQRGSINSGSVMRSNLGKYSL